MLFDTPVHMWELQTQHTLIHLTYKNLGLHIRPWLGCIEIMNNKAVGIHDKVDQIPLMISLTKGKLQRLMRGWKLEKWDDKEKGKENYQTELFWWLCCTFSLDLQVHCLKIHRIEFDLLGKNVFQGIITKCLLQF